MADTTEPPPTPAPDRGCSCHDKRWEVPLGDTVTLHLAETHGEPMVHPAAWGEVVGDSWSTAKPFTPPRAPPPPRGRDRCVLHAVYLL